MVKSNQITVIIAPPQQAPTTQPPPRPVPQPTQQGNQYWIQIYGVDPNIIMQNGTRISEQEWLNIQAKSYGINPSLFVRFTGSNGTVAYAYATGGKPYKSGEDSLGQPLIGGTGAGPLYVIGWNPYIYEYNGRYYDLLPYVMSKGVRSG